jgi:hypothetical protein
MARLREPEAATTGDAVPEHLAVCWVEDWVDPETEPVPDHVLSELSCGVGDLRFGWASLARRRWLVARERWCQERGMTKRDLMARHHGHMRPRWRSPSSSSSGTPPGGPLARARRCGGQAMRLQVHRVLSGRALLGE